MRVAEMVGVRMALLSKLATGTAASVVNGCTYIHTYIQSSFFSFLYLSFDFPCSNYSTVVFLTACTMAILCSLQMVSPPLPLPVRGAVPVLPEVLPHSHYAQTRGVTEVRGRGQRDKRGVVSSGTLPVFAWLHPVCHYLYGFLCNLSGSLHQGE